jgi:hypothetical protein
VGLKEPASEVEVEELEQEKPKATKKKVVMVNVIPVGKAQGESVLVQWCQDEDYFRAYVPISEVVGNQCPKDVLAQGIPYGIRWSQYLDVPIITPQLLERELHRRGVWTVGDLTIRRKSVQTAIRQVVGSAILEAVERFKKEHAEGGSK